MSRHDCLNFFTLFDEPMPLVRVYKTFKGWLRLICRSKMRLDWQLFMLEKSDEGLATNWRQFVKNRARTFIQVRIWVHLDKRCQRKFFRGTNCIGFYKQPSWVFTFWYFHVVKALVMALQFDKDTFTVLC